MLVPQLFIEKSVVFQNCESLLERLNCAVRWSMKTQQDKKNLLTAPVYHTPALTEGSFRRAKSVMTDPNKTDSCYTSQVLSRLITGWILHTFEKLLLHVLPGKLDLKDFELISSPILSHKKRDKNPGGKNDVRNSQCGAGSSSSLP